MEILKIELFDQVFDIELLSDQCPGALKKLKEHLPFRSELHYAKIAGEEIMAVMPFHAPVENLMDVSRAKAGMLAFWPQRHLLCLYYGQMQEEAASIGLLGYLEQDPAEFAAFGERVRREQGRQLCYGAFYIDRPDRQIPVIQPHHPVLHPFERDIWLETPGEITDLIQRPGVMRPVGPLLYAETDTHAFHEYLSASLRLLPDRDEALGLFKTLFLSHLAEFHTKLDGWYLLPNSASVISEYAKRLDAAQGPHAFQGLLENLMLFVGRLNYWFDALVPWNDFNESMNDGRP